MTAKIFTAEVQKLINQLIECRPGTNVFVLVYNEEENTGTKFGYGCEGCAAQHIMKLVLDKRITHNRVDGEIH